MSGGFEEAVRQGVTLLIGLAGQSGSGKTLSALKIAAGIAGGRRFAFADSESGRGLHYAPRKGAAPDNVSSFAFDHAEIRPPFTPQAYLDKILAAEKAGYPVCVVDNFSHEWIGEGGLHDWHDAIAAKMLDRKRAQFEAKGWHWDEAKEEEKISTAAWIDPKVEHKKMVQRLTQLRMHLILCFRAEEKLEIAQVVDEKTGKKKTEYRKLQAVTGADGFVPICEKNMPYELTLSFLLKADRPGVPIPIKNLQPLHRSIFPLDKPIDIAAGVGVAKWAAGDDGEAPASAPETAAVTLAGVVGSFKSATDEASLQAAWNASKGLPNEDRGAATVAYKERLRELKKTPASEPGAGG